VEFGRFLEKSGMDSPVPDEDLITSIAPSPARIEIGQASFGFFGPELVNSSSRKSSRLSTA
jgi:hypothetical protein